MGDKERTYISRGSRVARMRSFNNSDQWTNFSFVYLLSFVVYRHPYLWGVIEKSTGGSSASERSSSGLSSSLSSSLSSNSSSLLEVVEFGSLAGSGWSGSVGVGALLLQLVAFDSLIVEVDDKSSGVALILARLEGISWKHGEKVRIY